MEEQGLVVVNDNFLAKVTRFLRKIFSKKSNVVGYLNENEQNREIENQISYEYIKKDSEFVQKEIVEARSAFRKYVINNKKNISLDILNYIEEKLYENESKIDKIIEINQNNITFEDIQMLLQEQKQKVSNFKLRDKKTGRYKVPIGVIGARCTNIKECVENMFNAITTRNAIIILDENYSKYSTESLILLIIKECLRNFYIDDSIIQMVEKETIDLTKVDKCVNFDNKLDSKIDFKSRVELDSKLNFGNFEDVIYLYKEDDSFEDEVKCEVEKLKNLEKYKNCKIKVITGEFANVVDFLNKNKVYAVCMYTNNSHRAYKFINWVNCGNVFVNTGIRCCKNDVNSDNEYFNYKYVLHEDVF